MNDVSNEVSTQNNCLHDEDEYRSFLLEILNTFDSDNGDLFTVKLSPGTNLFEVFLNNLPAETRQHYNCHACRGFVNRYGNLVYISKTGQQIPATWSLGDKIPELYRKSVFECYKIVLRSRIDGVFYTEFKTLGSPRTGEWNHMSVVVPDRLINFSRIKSSSQAIAEKKEEFKMMLTGLLEFPYDAVKQAVKLLKADALYRTEKCLGVAEWLLNIHKIKQSVMDNRTKHNLFWTEVAKAPAGFCHIRSTMIGTLLEDIAKGYSFEVISRKFREKMDPMQHQRPQAPPSGKTKDQAEELVARMGMENSFKRRYARFEEIQNIWEPKIKTVDMPGYDGVFLKVKTKDSIKKIKDIEVPAQHITWVKFRDTVLNNANEIDFYTSPRADNYAALVTAVDFSAPPILQWDFKDQRNPVSWYLYNGGSHCNQWNLSVYSYHRVNSITLLPHMWNDKIISNQTIGLMLIIDKARDSRNPGLALFPETLISELHGIRSVIEAFSKEEMLEGKEESTACGFLYNKTGDFKLRVTTDDGKLEYIVDRWD